LSTAVVSVDAIALGIVPFDRESALGDVARTVLPHIVEAMLQGSGTITPDGILQRTHAIVSGVMAATGSGSELADLRKRVTTVLRQAASSELKEWLQPNPGQVWRLRRSLAADRGARTRELQTLQRLGSELIERLGSTTPPGVQLGLFDEFSSES
jgi:hypothetical protein